MGCPKNTRAGRLDRELGYAANQPQYMNASRQIRVLGVDDHPLMQEGIAAIINSQVDMRLVAQASTGREAIDRYREHRPDVTLMDLRLPDVGGIDALIAIRDEFPEARVIILTPLEDDVEVRRALAAGARACLLKDLAPSDLLDIVRQVHAGAKRLPLGATTHLDQDESAG